MAVLETIRNFFAAGAQSSDEVIVPAPVCEYSIHPLTSDGLTAVLHLNLRCFRNGDNYTKHTFDYLLTEPRTLSYSVRTDRNEIVAFAFVMVNENGSAHLTTIGVAPEHRRRGLAVLLLKHIEGALLKRGIGTLLLEVRVGNDAAQTLYRKNGFHVVQRIIKYYNNGEDCFLMMKAVN
ncbi:MAG: N-acetyltransferase [Acidobacteriota bacterium]